MSLAPGTRLGAYEVIALIGAGGMGEVYRARDTRLGRDVAIKIISGDFAAEGERVQRFEQEARAAAALNHPNILAVFDVGTHPSSMGPAIPYVVSELLEGETLRNRLAAGVFPVRKAIDYAIQIARGLAAAHDKNIVHRDLKPDNIFLTSDGRAKILDFGLAKLAHPDVTALGVSNLPTTPPNTQAGLVLGTVGYMSPEQVRGLPADHRADIFAFGIVLYEMLSGERAFHRETGFETMTAIVRDDPPSLPLADRQIPPGLARIVDRCLEKSPASRFQSAGDLVFALEGLTTQSDHSVTSAVATTAGALVRARRKRLVWGLAAATAATAIAMAAAFSIWRSTTGPGDVTRAVIDTSPAEFLQSRSSDANENHGHPGRILMAISPNGHRLVFSAVQNGARRLYLRNLDSLNAIPIAGTDGANSPFLSPDSEWIGFYADQQLKKVPIAGGPPVVICPLSLEPFGVSWGDDHRIVFAQGVGGLLEVADSGGTPQPLTTPDAKAGEVSHRLPFVLPGADTVLFTVTVNRFPRWDQTRVVALSRRTGAQTMLIDGGADARYLSTGHLAYVREGTLMAVPFDIGSLRTTGGPVGLTNDLMQSAYSGSSFQDSGAGQFSMSANGTLVYVGGGPFFGNRRSLVWADRRGQTERLPIPPDRYMQPRISPDGQRIAVGTQGQRMDIWVFDIARTTFARLTSQGRNGTPVWTRDGSRLAYRSSTSGLDGLFWQPSDRSGLPERFYGGDYNHTPIVWTPDGQSMAFYRLMGTNTDIWLVSLRDRKARPLLDTPAYEAGLDFSPDGRWIAYSTEDSGREEVYVQPYPGPGPRQQISARGGQSPVWRGDGREIFYMRQIASGRSAMIAVPVSVSGDTLRAGTETQLFEGDFHVVGPARGYDVTADGSRFIVAQNEKEESSAPNRMILVLNWIEELKRQMKTATN